MSLRRFAFFPLLALAACGTTTTVALDGGSVDGGLDTGKDAAADSGLSPGQCRGSDDCAVLGSSYFCGVSVLPPMCSGQCEGFSGITCQGDTDCADAGAGMVCSQSAAPSPCYCFHGGAQPQPHCAKGCASASDCGPGLSCDSTHRCVAAACTLPSDCGSGNFTCTGSVCAAKPCAKDAECANYCVMGACSAEIGGCGQAVP